MVKAVTILLTSLQRHSSILLLEERPLGEESISYLIAP